MVQIVGVGRSNRHYHHQYSKTTDTTRLRTFVLVIVVVLVVVWMVVVVRPSTTTVESNASNPFLLFNFDSNSDVEKVQPKGTTTNHVVKNTAISKVARTIRTDNNDGSIVAAHFNRIPLIRLNHSSSSAFSSQAHCIAPSSFHATKTDKVWKFRNCYYRTLCFDIPAFNSNERPQQPSSVATTIKPNLQYYLISSSHNNNHNFEDDSTELQNSNVALGGINPRWDSDIPKLKDVLNSTKVRWKPNIHTQGSTATTTKTTQHYEFRDETIFIPFHSMAGHNVGHLLWDDFYAIYKLLDLYGFYDDTVVARQQVVLLRQKLVDTKLYANCDIQRNKRLQCKDNYDQFLYLMNISNATFSTSNTYEFTSATATSSVRSNADTDATATICAKKAIAGMGYFTDHGRYDHGWDITSTSASTTATIKAAVVIPHNRGRGRQFYNFGQYMLKNNNRRKNDTNRTSSRMTNVVDDDKTTTATINLIFSINSSRDSSRRLDFADYINALKQQQQQQLESTHLNAAVSSSSSFVPVRISSYEFRTMSIEEQIQLISTSCDIYVTVCGGGAMTSTFQQRGTTLIVFYSESHGIDFHNQTSFTQPTRLDNDLLSHGAAHLRVHWLPIESTSIRIFLQLVRHEITSIERRRHSLSLW